MSSFIQSNHPILPPSRPESVESTRPKWRSPNLTEMTYSLAQPAPRRSPPKNPTKPKPQNRPEGLSSSSVWVHVDCADSVDSWERCSRSCPNHLSLIPWIFISLTEGIKVVVISVQLEENPLQKLKCMNQHLFLIGFIRNVEGSTDGISFTFCFAVFIRAVRFE